MSKKDKYKDPRVNFYRTAEFKKLQNEWYDKLTSSGFFDLEWLDKKSGAGQDTPFFKVKVSNLLAVYDPETENHFRHARNFLEHYHFRHKRKWKRYRVLWRLYCDGLPYRQMIPVIKKEARLNVSVFWISKHINRLRNEMLIFDATDPEGICDLTDAQAAEGLE